MTIEHCDAIQLVLLRAGLVPLTFVRQRLLQCDEVEDDLAV